LTKSATVTIPTEEYVETISLKHIPGQFQHIEKYSVPVPLKKGEYYFDQANQLHYKRDRNGHYSVSTNPQVHLYYIYHGQNRCICLASFIKDYFGLKRIRTDRINKLAQIMPKQIPLVFDPEANKYKLSKVAIEQWLAQYE